MSGTTIAILSDHALFREGVKELLGAHGLTQVNEYATSDLLLAAAHGHPPDFLFVDLDHEHEDVSSLARSLRRALRHTHIVVIGSALRQGASEGALDGELETPRANAEALIAAADLTAQRRPSPEVLRQLRIWSAITPRQRDVLRWLATGADNRTIGRKLRIGERAIKAHVSALLGIFGLTNRTELALVADHAGLRPPGARTCA
jgi:DNA-binding NarL/FixJ family response regulator